MGSEEGVVVVTTQALQKEKKWRERKLFFCVVCQLLWAGNANAKCVAVAVVGCGRAFVFQSRRWFSASLVKPT